MAAGNATQIKVGYAPRTVAPDQKAQSANVAPTPAGAGPPATGPAGLPPATAPPVTAAPPAPPATAPPGPPVTAPPGALPAGGAAALINFVPPNAETQLNSTITVTLTGDNISNMISAAAQVRYDPRILRINNIVTGDLMQRGFAQNAPTEPSKNILNDTGQADMRMVRGAALGGVSGMGGLFTIVFQAVGRGNTTVSVSSVSLTGPNGQPIATTSPPPLVVNVR